MSISEDSRLNCSSIVKTPLYGPTARESVLSETQGCPSRLKHILPSTMGHSSSLVNSTSFTRKVLVCAARLFNGLAFLSYAQMRSLSALQHLGHPGDAPTSSTSATNVVTATPAEDKRIPLTSRLVLAANTALNVSQLLMAAFLLARKWRKKTRERELRNALRRTGLHEKRKRCNSSTVAAAPKTSHKLASKVHGAED